MAGTQPVIYLTAGEVLTFNREILRRAGQTSALLRERGLLEGAIQRPRNAAYYEGADLVTQAAIYMVSIALNHPFVDGNKRTGYVSGMTFLQSNGYFEIDVTLNDVQLGEWLEQVVNRSITFDAFVQLFRARLAR
jgi:death-on-curing protein